MRHCEAVVESSEKIKNLKILENNLKSWVQFSTISLSSSKIAVQLNPKVLNAWI